MIMRTLGRPEDALLALDQDETEEMLNPHLLFKRCQLLLEEKKTEEFLLKSKLLFSRHFVTIRKGYIFWRKYFQRFGGVEIKKQISTVKLIFRFSTTLFTLKWIDLVLFSQIQGLKKNRTFWRKWWFQMKKKCITAGKFWFLFLRLN